MKIGLVINEIATEKDNYTTIRLARHALGREHEVIFIGLGDFIYDPCGAVHAHAVMPERREFADDAEFLRYLQNDAGKGHIDLESLDVMLLRSDPAEEVSARPWASTSALLFAQLAAARGVLVLSDPTHLTDAQNKTYFQNFPEVVRPATCISRDTEVIRRFIDSHGGAAAIKPLQGSGGKGVFVVRAQDGGNLNQMIEAVTRDGYAVVQEYLPRAAEGDVRLLLLNGRPLCVDGTYACFHRFNESGDARSNISAGGTFDVAAPDADALRLAEAVAPKLIQDGMYLVGLDIVGDKLLEINVDTPGGINFAEDLTGVNFSGHILDDLERKVRLQRYYEGRLDNTLLSTV